MIINQLHFITLVDNQLKLDVMESTITKEKVGLFLASLQIGGDKPGAPLFMVKFLVYTPGRTLSGIGDITQAVNPPVDVNTNLHGDYSYMCVMPKNCHLLVIATGYPIIKWPHHGGIGPVLQPNVHLRMVLTEDWKTGTATYQYVTPDGKWHEVENAPVKMI